MNARYVRDDNFMLTNTDKLCHDICVARNSEKKSVKVSAKLSTPLDA